MRQRGRAGAQTRAGMTLIEVIVALVILAGAMLSMGSFVTSFVHNVALSNVRTIALELASDRIEDVKAAGDYDNLEAVWSGTESPVASYAGYTRQTLIQLVGGGLSDLDDYKLITVIVSAPGLTTPVKKTTAITRY